MLNLFVMAISCSIPTKVKCFSIKNPTKCDNIRYIIYLGVIGIRMDGIEDAHIMDIEIRNMENQSPLASGTCGDYTGPHDGGNPGTRMREGGMSTDMRGISIVDGDVIVHRHNIIEDLESWYGDAVAIDLLEDTIFEFDDDAVADLEIDDIKGGTKMTMDLYRYLQSVDRTPFPNNFEECNIKIADNAFVIGGNGLNETDCKVPQFANSN